MSGHFLRWTGTFPPQRWSALFEDSAGRAPTYSKYITRRSECRKHGHRTIPARKRFSDGFKSEIFQCFPAVKGLARQILSTEDPYASVSTSQLLDQQVWV